MIYFKLIWEESKIKIEGNSVIIFEKPLNWVEVKVLSGNLEKKVGEHELKRKNTTLTLVSPWTRILLAGGGEFKGYFFEVEYNVRWQNKNLFAKIVINDIPRKIILTALKYRGSTAWSYASEKVSEHQIIRGSYMGQGLYMGKPRISNEKVPEIETFTYPQGTWKM